MDANDWGCAGRRERETVGKALFAVLFVSSAVYAQERPYLVTYDHFLEEPGALEFGFNPTFGMVPGGNDFLAASIEFEYGATAWWTTEL
jgi:hypothetical protein